jgi:DNA-binding IclR family transcriptional regulator
MSRNGKTQAERVFDALYYGHGLHIRELSDAENLHRIPRPSIRRALYRLVAAGMVVKGTDGKYRAQNGYRRV